MVDLMNGKKSEVFHIFMNLATKAFLASRKKINEIVSIVCCFADSNLPCFQYKENVLFALKERFLLDLNDDEAATFFKNCIYKAANDWTTNAYDGVQKVQNNIYY
jgi:phosphatidylinositol kinase/protein kinase (PI-3  family)